MSMERENLLNNSIALIGPKQVGKTFVAEKLAEEKNTPNFVLSSDLLTNLVVFDMAGKWHDLVETTELAEVGKLYKSTFNFHELRPIVETLAKCQQAKNLSQKAKKVAMSYWKARLLEDATDIMKTPYILDAGADIGAVIELSNYEENLLAEFFYMPYDFIETRMPSFLKKFGSRIYLEPGETYKSLDGRCNDIENKIFLESGKSYKPYATTIINCDTLYNTNKPKEETVKKFTSTFSANLTPSTFGE